jgi:4-hydroxy-tetrahydrodipicolinate reductase
MLRITIVGAAGRMGRRLMALTAEDPDLTLVGAVDVAAAHFADQDAGELAGVGQLDVPVVAALDAELLAKSDAVVDFSAPHESLALVQAAVAAGVAYVLGTTGHTPEQKAAIEAAGAKGRLVMAPNFSVGVNTLFVLVEQAAKILGDDYDIEIVEMHHNKKKDAPSGTAERLGEIAAAAREYDYQTETTHGRQGLVGARPKREIGMHSLRGGDVVGDHTVTFATGGERLELSHKASSRDTFASGALRAAKFAATAAPGIYDMKAVLGL